MAIDPAAQTQGLSGESKARKTAAAYDGIEGLRHRSVASRSKEEHKIYPYLVREVAIIRPNQVRATDVTYIRMRSRFAYLVAVLDWFSRYVLSWQLANSLARLFRLEALDAARPRATPDICNSDQGCQFTSNDFTTSVCTSLSITKHRTKSIFPTLHG